MRKKIAGRYFEWDEEKNRLNKQKHKVSFETAARVFSDPFFVECPDETHSDEELRYKVLGMVNSASRHLYGQGGRDTHHIRAKGECRRKECIQWQSFVNISVLTHR